MRQLYTFFAVIWLAGCLAGTQAMAQGASRSLDDDLMYRITFGRVDDIVSLLDKNAGTNIYGPSGETPLIIAVTRNSPEAEAIMKALLAKGADPNFADKNGTYPLEIAIKDGRASLIKILIEAGADIHAKSVKGVPMTDLAQQKNQNDINDVITAAMKKEVEAEAKLHNPERLLTLVQQFTSKVCEFTYWSNFLTSEQNPALNDSSRQKIMKTKEMGEKFGSDIARYFPKVNISSYMEYASGSITNVFTSFPDNKARSEAGIGTDEDALKRCLIVGQSSRESVAKVLEDQRKAEDEAAHKADLMR